MTRCINTEPPCPNLAAHHPGEPSGYTQHGAWLERESITHWQEPCPDCGRWAIFHPRPAGDTICRTCHGTISGIGPRCECGAGTVGVDWKILLGEHEEANA